MTNKDYSQHRGFFREIMGYPETWIILAALYGLAELGVTVIKANQYDKFFLQQAEVRTSDLSPRAKNDSTGTLAKHLESWFPGIGPFSVNQARRNSRLARDQLITVEEVRAEQNMLDSADAAYADSIRAERAR